MLHYTPYLNPSSKEWVTFIHGAGGSSAIWFKQIRDFKEHYNVLLIDLRGHGRSKSPVYEKLQRYSFAVIGDEVIEVLNHLNIPQTHLVGISLGTIIIRDLSERYPDRVSSLIMGGAVMKLNVRGQVLMRLGVLLQSIVPYLVLYKLFAWIIMPKRKHRESRNLFVREARKLYQKEFKRWFTLAADINPLLKIFRMKDTGIPTLYIMGSEDHMFLPSIRKLVADHRMALLHVIPECGHVVNVERPLAFNAECIRFINALGRS
ncbi:MAG: alpha/beta hydrolase [Flavobacteriales bacterium]|nr:alpha/beta hydrolase [Flavobacteriales bacterium]